MAPGLEVRKLVEGSAGRRQEHNTALTGRLGVGVGLGHRCAEVGAGDIGDLAVEGLGKIPCRLPDQIGARHPREEVGEGGDPALLGSPAGDPVDPPIAGQGLAGRIAVGGLGVIDEAHAPDVPDGLHPVGQPRKAEQAIGDIGGRDAEAPDRSVGGRRVLPVMATGKRARAVEVGDLHRPVPGGVIQLALQGIDAPTDGLGGGDRHDGPAVRRLGLGTDPLPPGIIDPDDRGIPGALVQEDPPLGGHVALHAPMSVQVVRRDVEEDGDVRLKAGGKVKLVGRKLQDIDRAAMHVGQVQDPHPDIAADAGIPARLGADMADQGGGGRLPVGTGDGDDMRALVGGRQVDGTGEELDVAKNLDPGLSGHLDGPVGLGMGQGHAGRQHEGVKLGPLGDREIDNLEPFRLSRSQALGALVPNRDLCPSGQEGARGGQSGPGKPEDRDGLAFEAANRDQAPSPTSASASRGQGWPA